MKKVCFLLAVLGVVLVLAVGLDVSFRQNRSAQLASFMIADNTTMSVSESLAFIDREIEIHQWFVDYPGVFDSALDQPAYNRKEVEQFRRLRKLIEKMNQ